MRPSLVLNQGGMLIVPHHSPRCCVPIVLCLGRPGGLPRLCPQPMGAAPTALSMGVVAVISGQGTQGAPREPHRATGPPPLPRTLGLGQSAPSIRLWTLVAASRDTCPARHLGAGLCSGDDGGGVGRPCWPRGGDQWLSFAHHLTGVPPILAASCTRWWRTKRSRAPGHTRALLLLRWGAGAAVATSPGLPMPPWVGAAGPRLLAVGAAAIGGVGALQCRVRLIPTGDVPDISLLDLLSVNALPGRQDPERGPPRTQRPGLGFRLGSSTRTCALPSPCHGAAFSRHGGTEQGAAGLALAPSRDITTTGFGRAIPGVPTGLSTAALQC